MTSADSAQVGAYFPTERSPIFESLLIFNISFNIVNMVRIRLSAIVCARGLCGTHHSPPYALDISVHWRAQLGETGQTGRIGKAENDVYNVFISRFESSLGN